MNVYKKRDFNINNWILFVIGSALTSVGVEFAIKNIIALTVFCLITGIGALVVVLARAMKKFVS